MEDGKVKKKVVANCISVVLGDILRYIMGVLILPTALHEMFVLQPFGSTAIWLCGLVCVWCPQFYWFGLTVIIAVALGVHAPLVH